MDHGSLIRWILIPGLLCMWALTITLAQEMESYQVTPVPFLDVNKDLKVLYFGAESDYFISTYEADSDTAHQVCQNLTTLTGKQFHVLTIEKAGEAKELFEHLQTLDVSGIWTAGEKTLDTRGNTSLHWNTIEGKVPIQFKDFWQGAVRKRREVQKKQEALFGNETQSSVIQLQPWLVVGETKQNGRCRNARYSPPCEPIQCNTTVSPCSTTTPACEIKNQSNCSVVRPPCSAKCENCTVTPPTCYANPKPCTVQVKPCQTVQVPCEVVRPPCETKRPPCKITHPPCVISTPPPCTTTKPCIPTFSKEDCTTVTYPCTVNSKNQTVCPPPKTTCKENRCPPPDVCQSPAIICPPPLIYCPPECTTCPDPIVNCPAPIIYCPEPEVNCPKPDVVCTKPQVVCSAPVVNCPGIITSCGAPDLVCPPPKVECPPPDVVCTKPEPCVPPEVSTPPPCTPEPTSVTTTQKPCQGCGCIYMSKQHKFKWDIGKCRDTYHFICEG